MSINPFASDAAVPARLAAIGPERRRDIANRVKKALSVHMQQPGSNDGSVLAGDIAAELVSAFGLASVRDLMCLLLDTAKDIARPTISDFHVGAVWL